MIALACILIAAGGAAVLWRRVPTAFSTAVQLAGCIAGLVAAASAFRSPVAARLPWHVPGGTLRFVLDPLAAFFLVPVLVVAGLGMLYGEGYWSEREHPWSARKLRAFYAALAVGLVLVVIAGDAWTFLAGWEIVGLSAFFLVVTDGEPEALRAGWIYLIATHVATLVLFAMFALVRLAAGSWELRRAIIPAHSPYLAAVLILALAGFGTKAGAMPFHVWLPEAHAAAPSHVSAILSAVVLKIGIYGLVRVISMTAGLPGWFGVTLIAGGCISGILGVVFALAQHDLKRLLAYHSIENIGIILLGLGVGVLGLTHHRADIAALGIAGALLHVWNHAAFKSLLFYAAGSVVHTTHTRNMEAMGGLFRSMRTTAVAFLIGAIAICGLPPLNGFVSEWLVYIASFKALLHAETSLASIVVPALGLIGALAVACFVKAYSVVFLGSPRSSLETVHEASPSMRVTMLVLCGACVAIGFLPQSAGAVAMHAAAALYKPNDAVGSALAPLTLMGPLLVGVAALVAVTVGVLVRVRRTTATWDCGYAQPTPRMQYTASSFAQQLVELFRWALLPVSHRPRIVSLFPEPDRFESHVPDPVLDRVLLPGIHGTGRMMSFARIIQAGRLQTYLIYVGCALVVLLTWSAL